MTITDQARDKFTNKIMNIYNQKPAKYPAVKIYYFILKKKWFDMILAGIKTEEYRKMSDYWRKRLKGINEYKNVILHFRNGYSPKSRVMITEFLGMNTDQGNSDWGWDANEYYYVLKIGKIIKKERC